MYNNKPGTIKIYVQGFISEKVIGMCHILSCLTRLFTNIKKWKMKFWSVNSYSSYDLKPNWLQCIAKT